jgi:hypothetical protein
MNVAILPKEEFEIITAVEYLPTVAIILPFQPVMTSKAELQHKLKVIADKVELEIISSYSKQQALPVIIKLRTVIRNLNYNTHKKSIAIFVSPIVEKVFYLSFNVEERVMVDEAFKLSDIGYCKVQSKQYLVLLLTKKLSKIYLATDGRLMLIKSNIPDNISIEFAGQQQYELDKFVKQMDVGLSMILRTHPFPVYVMGDESAIKSFRKITWNKENVVEFITGDFGGASIDDINDFIESATSDWQSIKQQSLLQMLAKAKDQHKATCGIKQVWKASKFRKGSLLLIEKSFTYEREITPEVDILYYADLILNNAFYIKDLIDEVVEKVLENGGDIEFVDDGALDDQGHIALMQYYY